jgi:hypothetical protein
VSGVGTGFKREIEALDVHYRLARIFEGCDIREGNLMWKERGDPRIEEG